MHISQRSMPRAPRRAKVLLGVLAAGIVSTLALAGCSAPGGSTSSASSTLKDPITAPVTAAQVASEGKITLNVWADQGEQQLMSVLVPIYEKKYPNVTLKIQFKSFNDWTATILNAMNSSSAPDVAQGNQGPQIDGALVKAGLIRPLNDVAKVYKYTEAAGAAIRQLEWTPDGKTFGSGNIYGLAPDNQMVGLFYNREMLKKLGATVPTTLPEFESVLAKAKAAGETPIVLGNSDKGSAAQAFSAVQGAFSPAADTVNWVLGKSGSDFNTTTNREALELWAKWAQDGTISPGYNGVSPDDAAKNFAKGAGLFYIGGNWEASNISDGSQFGFAPAVSGAGNVAASNGSFGLPWHISSKSTHTLAAIAFVALINEPQSAKYLEQVNRVPIATDDVTSADPMMTDLISATKKQLANNGGLYFYDWSTPTMFNLFTSDMQEVMGGQLSATSMLQAVQSNWTSYHKTGK